MRGIPFTAESGEKGVIQTPYRDNHPNCYICGENSNWIIEYLVGVHNLEGDLREFRDLFDKNGLKYFIVDRDDACVEIGACNKHKQDLENLSEKVDENKGLLSKRVLKKLDLIKQK